MVRQVDAEGEDERILRSVVEASLLTPSLWPRVIQHEVKHMPEQGRSRVDKMLRENRYVLLRESDLRCRYTCGYKLNLVWHRM